MTADVVRTLHVEDDPIQHRLVSFWLKKSLQPTFELLWVKGEEEALNRFAGESIDLILLDYQLAEGDGLQLLKRIRAFDPFVPIVALSASASEEVAGELLQAGANEFYCKTELTGSLLLEVIRRVRAGAKSRFAAESSAEASSLS